MLGGSYSEIPFKKIGFLLGVVFIGNAAQAISNTGFVGTIPAIAPSPLDNPSTPEKIELGRQLFFDPRLSATKTISCSSCHSLDAVQNPNGADGHSVSTGVWGRRGDRNAPTVLNSGMRSVLFWDGRATSLEEQALGPIMNPSEMGMTEQMLLNTVQGIAGYRKQFQTIFRKNSPRNSTITLSEIAKAIAAYERTLNTPDSDFDRYQKGEFTALTVDAKRGWEKFQIFSCKACHGASTFQSKDYFIRFPAHESNDYVYLYGFTKDPGRYKATRQPHDKNYWRVPSLRNVAITAPYFHNGSVDTLEQAIRIMGKAQLGKVFSDQDISDLVEFLKSLTGKLPKQQRPTLP